MKMRGEMGMGMMMKTMPWRNTRSSSMYREREGMQARRRKRDEDRKRRNAHAAAIYASSSSSSSSSSLSSSSNERRQREEDTKTNASFNPAETGDDETPLLVRAARGEEVPRAPAWMMRQAGRYMRSYRELALQYPSFRVRSETAELAVQTSMQPFEAFRPDGVILFSDILTPLPALGIDFEIDDIRGPIMETTIRSDESVGALRPELDLEYLEFVHVALSTLKNELKGTGTALLGFVGSPWTLATYAVEGGTSKVYATIKAMCAAKSPALEKLLTTLANAIAQYSIFQIEAGADCVQIFDSWGGQLPPAMWDVWSGPYIDKVVDKVRERYPNVPLTLYVNGSGGLIERMANTRVDVIGLDWTVDMMDARKRMGEATAVQGNVDPAVLLADGDAVEKAVKECVKAAGTRGHVLNLGHGVLVGTPEENVKRFFDVARELSYGDANI